MKHIRTRVFRVTQHEMAAIVGTTQASVSRWEKGQLSPDLAQLGRIREAAAKRGLPWDDSWIFEVPAAADADAA